MTRHECAVCIADTWDHQVSRGLSEIGMCRRVGTLIHSTERPSLRAAAVPYSSLFTSLHIGIKKMFDNPSVNAISKQVIQITKGSFKISIPNVPLAGRVWRGDLAIETSKGH